MRDLHDGTLGIAVEQNIGLGIEQDRAADLVRPIIVMRDAAQRGFNAAEHDGAIAIGFAAALRIDDRGAVRPFAAFALGAIAVVMAQPPVRRVAVDHGIHIAARDAEKQHRPAQGLERFGALPIRLRDDADAKALALKQPADQGHAEAWMIDISVAGDEYDVAGVPAERVHFGTAHRQERRCAEPMRPIFAIGEEGFCVHAGDLAYFGRNVMWRAIKPGFSVVGVLHSLAPCRQLLLRR